MARLIDQDFGRLKVFIDQYSIGELLQSKAREQLIRRGHKHCLAAMQMWAIAEHLAKSGNFRLRGLAVATESLQFNQLSESFSDLTSAFFAALHGLYKPGHMSLRSAVETFARGVAGLYSQEAVETTNVYRLFEIARGCAAFSNVAAKHFETLHQQYVLLCGFTHSSTPLHMVRNHAMSNFPKQDIEHLRVWVKHLEAVVSAILSVLAFSNRDLYLRAAPHAQDVYEEVMPKDARLFCLGVPAAKA